MEPDIDEALKRLTKQMGMMQAEKVFGKKPAVNTDLNVPADLQSQIPGTTEHPLGQPTPYKSLDESAKSEVLARNANNGEELIEDDFGDVPDGETSDEEDEEGERPQKSFGIMSTLERSASMPMKNAPVASPPRGRGRPRRA